MKRKFKVVLVVLASLVGVSIALWWPYESMAVPEWTVQVIDESGRPIPQVQVNEEWIDPLEDGIVSSDSRNTDANGRVTFPGRTTHNRLIIRLVDRLSADARVFTCWQGRYGDISWERASANSTKRACS